jgi:hypothetical protein
MILRCAPSDFASLRLRDTFCQQAIYPLTTGVGPMMISILANTGIPMICLQMPGMICALIPVILIEGLLVRRWLRLSYKEAFGGMTVANLASTLVGIPLAWLVMAVVELSVMWPVAAAADRWHWNMNSPAWHTLGFLASIAWLPPAEESLYWMVPAALALLLVPSFIVSLWIERGIAVCSWRHVDVAWVRRAILKANLISYALLFAATCGWLAVELAGKRGLHSLW